MDEEVELSIVRQVKRFCKGRTLIHLQSVLSDERQHQAFREVPAWGDHTDLPAEELCDLPGPEIGMVQGSGLSEKDGFS